MLSGYIGRRPEGTLRRSRCRPIGVQTLEKHLVETTGFVNTQGVTGVANIEPDLGFEEKPGSALPSVR